MQILYLNSPPIPDDTTVAEEITEEMLSMTEAEAENRLEAVINGKEGRSQTGEMKELIARTVEEAHRAL